MKEIKCDRCGAIIGNDEERQLSLVNNTETSENGNMETVADDLCPRCVNALRDFLKPLPVPATEVREVGTPRVGRGPGG